MLDLTSEPGNWLEEDMLLVSPHFQLQPPTQTFEKIREMEKEALQDFLQMSLSGKAKEILHSSQLLDLTSEPGNRLDELVLLVQFFQQVSPHFFQRQPPTGTF